MEVWGCKATVGGGEYAGTSLKDKGQPRGGGMMGKLNDAITLHEVSNQTHEQVWERCGRAGCKPAGGVEMVGAFGAILTE